ncbi:hypothetical protein A5658_19395 [Mycobacterium sp. 1245111.1]|uniref:hypothetical protein n=1 Tax=Mycobacterium sp. 1245111.1 TaxID=1834073 RepID=UPI0007FD888B|nr:hypothetical protein [Mycobacterium sp. 1245111.1]OBK41280.1 hypothetical protein A5658_19395 [Mycobacterium sp. 1245111.1]
MPPPESPFVDSINALLTSLPAYDAAIIADQLAAGNYLDSILDPMAANTALAPCDLLLGVAPALAPTLGTAVNLANVFSRQPRR